MSKRSSKLLIVDGYNVLRSGSRYAHLSAPDYTDDAFNHAREMLINDVSVFAGSERECVIVFDGGGNELSAGSQDCIGRIRIVFSPAGSSADNVIEKLAHEARQNHTETTVVTSDAAIQDAVFGCGISRMSANDFSREVVAVYEETENERRESLSEKHTVAERIDTETLDKLKALRDETL